jgi:hypothetical protein
MEWLAVVEWFGRPEIETDEVREHRITMEAVVDAYSEKALGAYSVRVVQSHLGLRSSLRRVCRRASPVLWSSWPSKPFLERTS